MGRAEEPWDIPSTYNVQVWCSLCAQTLPGMMKNDPCGSMATKHTLRMLGVSEAEMPHMRHISFRRRLSDWRFLLLSRMLQSARAADGETLHSRHCRHCFKRERPPYLLTLRVLFFPVDQSRPSTALMSSAPSPGTNPTASAGPASERSPFSSVLCAGIVAYVF